MCTVMYLHDLDSLKKNTKEYRINQSKAEFCFDNLISESVINLG